MIDATTVGTARTILLLGAAVLLVYAIVRYRHNVLHRPAFALAVGTAVGLAGSQLLAVADAPTLAIELCQLVAACLYLAGTWRFAAEFIVFEHEEDMSLADIDFSAEGGGFQDD